jgi:hypothetical protein
MASEHRLVKSSTRVCGLTNGRRELDQTYMYRLVQALETSV